jgi:autotransporter-associated beta strand protein
MYRFKYAMLVATLAFSASARAENYTWTGDFFGVWNQALNWSPTGIPQLANDIVNFTGNNTGSVNISASVQSELLNFSNPAGDYTLTSNVGVTLTGVSEINVAAGVTGLQTINLANVATGSLRMTRGLIINNNSTAAGTTLRVGPNTVISPIDENVVGGGLLADGVGTTEISGSYINTNCCGTTTGEVRKYGPGTLILSSPTNKYFGGTFIYGGTLQLGSGTAIPTFTNVSVYSDGKFNIGGLSNTATTAIDTLQVAGGGSFLVPTGNGDYFLRHLEMYGGKVDFSGSADFWLHFKSGGSSNAPIVIYPDDNAMTSEWIGAGTSRMLNDTGNPLAIYVHANAENDKAARDIDLDAGIILSSGVGSGGAGSNPTFIKDGAGTMRLTNPLNTANINIAAGRLRVDDMANLGSGIVTVNNGILQYSGPSATTTKNLTIDGTGKIQVLSAGVDLNFDAIISQTAFASLHVLGPGADSPASKLILVNDNNYFGHTFVYDNAILAIPTINNVGSASPIGSNLFSTGISLGASDSRGTLLLTGILFTYNSNRKITVNGLYGSSAGGAIGVQYANTNLTMNGQITGSGSLIKTGAGTLLPTSTSNNYSGGTYIEAGGLYVSNDAALGSAAVTIFSSGTLRYTNNTATSRHIFLDRGTVEAPSGMSLNAAGALQGEGTVVGNIVNLGFVEPHNDTANGLLHVSGNYVQASSGKLFLFVDLFLTSGINPKLDVTNDVVLNGTLEIGLNGMGQFRGSRSFDVLDWGGILDGMFSTLQLPTFGGAFTWDTSQLYTTGVLKLTGPPLEGDYNADGVVDAADYVRWRKDPTNYGGDPDGYNTWRSHFGKMMGSGSGATANVAAPEPASLVTPIMGSLVICFLRRRAATS